MCIALDLLNYFADYVEVLLTSVTYMQAHWMAIEFFRSHFVLCYLLIPEGRKQFCYSFELRYRLHVRDVAPSDAELVTRALCLSNPRMSKGEANARCAALLSNGTVEVWVSSVANPGGWLCGL